MSISLPSFIYAISLNLGLGTGGALLVDKPTTSGFIFSLGVETRFTPAWSIETGALLLVTDNILGKGENKYPGAYALLRYRAFLTDRVALTAAFGPTYANHPHLVPNQLQIMSDLGITTEGMGLFGGSLTWRHISSGQAVLGNKGVDYIAISINFNMKGD